jgi:hypothetical protein
MDVMDAIQRMRHKAMEHGYLQSNSYVSVSSNDGYIEILPTSPDIVYVPRYDPFVVLWRPGIAGAIQFGPGITIGVGVSLWWWWGRPALVWSSGSILIDRHPWMRGFGPRSLCASLCAPPVRPVVPRVERYDVLRRR